MKVCNACGEEKEDKKFSKYRNKCKKCEGLDHKKSRDKRFAENPELHEKQKKKSLDRYYEDKKTGKPIDTHLKRTYGISLEDFNKMNEEQNGVCAICKKPENPRICDRLSVDHDHLTGKVRALLCRACNYLLGIVKDNPMHLRVAAEYLEKN